MTIAVQTYAYKGRNAEGKVVSGKLEAPSESAVVARMKTLGLTPVSITEASAGTGLNREISLGAFEKGVGLKDLAIMSRQLATMVSAGIPLLKSLTILSEQTESKALAKVLGTVRAQVESGSSLSEALARHSDVFPPLMIHLVRAGETGGFLDQSLESIARTFEADVKLRATIKSALTYPVIVLIMAIVAVIAMLIFIVPIFEKMFADLGGELPIPTQILVVLSRNMIWILPILVVGGVAGAIWWRRNKHADRVRAKVDPIKLKLPVFGQLTKKVAIARFARNFATMTKSGVPVLQSLAIVGDTSGNWVIQEALHKVQDSVRTGKSIAAPLAQEPVFPSMVVQMIAVGEDSGSMEPMLNKIADFYEDEVQTTTEQLTSLIEPLMIGFIGLVIGGMIVALYLPIFTIFQQIH
ncbi:type II secretion system F family protein [Salinibacterium soli]|uniref:Type II secretion system F family protein n=1 Tax=Antiquaquibacter soli TaxID=3064523 RepID=A0ABT9BP85_9MICO|nr:type II secretion system F family protein [Protaetiibacter sp. WY-16]MDO7882846.1 type II secretion system F family protein [Protaetiibacter sp. WY-16]